MDEDKFVESIEDGDIRIEEPDIVDEAENDDSVIPVRYDISSYGADFDVDGVVKRLRRGDIFIPKFQRDYVWNQTEASRFIESLLLGLPVPGIFLAKDSNTNKLLVIDGQQRLKTLHFFYDGVFNPKDEDKTQRVFKLLKVQEQFMNLTYANLEESDRIKLDDSIIHATIIKQESPEDSDTSVYHVFERLNNGGRRLQPQEIRKAIYHGSLNELIKELNKFEPWREIYGRPSRRLKDEELILRFFAFLYSGGSYSSPMYEFLNKYNKANQYIDTEMQEELKSIFIKTITVIHDSLKQIAFRPEKSFNAAVFDAVMVGVAKKLLTGDITNSQSLLDIYVSLLKNDDFAACISKATSSDPNVKKRLSIAQEKFANIK